MSEHVSRREHLPPPNTAPISILRCLQHLPAFLLLKRRCVDMSLCQCCRSRLHQCGRHPDAMAFSIAIIRISTDSIPHLSFLKIVVDKHEFNVILQAQNYYPESEIFLTKICPFNYSVIYCVHDLHNRHSDLSSSTALAITYPHLSILPSQSIFYALYRSI